MNAHLEATETMNSDIHHSQLSTTDAGNTDATGKALTVAELNHDGVSSHQVFTAGFYDSSWDFVVRSALGKASRGGADAGEVLATIAGVEPGDRMGWFQAWTGLGSRIAAVGEQCARAGHRVSAARAYLRASIYLSIAVNSIDGLDGTDDLLPTFHAARGAWEDFVATTRWPVERVHIPYEGSNMPGWLFHPDSSTDPRPTLVVNNGSDGSPAGAWCAMAEGGLERGYRVLLFDGPGQQSMLLERDIPFRPDWEKVLTPVVDFLTERDDVDATKIVVYGISQAGYWVPRALAFEHRFAAAVADGGVVDISRAWTVDLPAPLLDLYRSGQKAAFDARMDQVMQAPSAKAVRINWEFRARPYGVTGYSAVLDAVLQYQLHDLTEQITTPLYITDVDGEQLLPGQSAELAAKVANATLVRYTQEDGASYHCQPMAREISEQRIFDWLDEQLGCDR